MRLITALLATMAMQLALAGDAPADLPRDAAISGLAFLTEETKALQHDDFANPGLLWVDRGRALFNQKAGKASCRSCHADELAGVFVRYPAVEASSGQLITVNDRINRCRSRQQGLPPLAPAADELLALSMFVAAQSRGEPYAVSIDGNARLHFERGRAYFFTRRGQLNLACHQCHDQNWGKKLRGDTISQGQPTAFPGYRMEWQSAGSLHRRIQDCDAGVRAQPLQQGADEYKALELYLAWRAGSLPVESPGVRR